MRFSSDFDDRGLNTENADGKYRLFEIDGVLGETLLSSKEKVFIKGERTDEAVMCTETSTYEIRKKRVQIQSCLFQKHLKMVPSVQVL